MQRDNRDRQQRTSCRVTELVQPTPTKFGRCNYQNCSYYN